MRARKEKKEKTSNGGEERTDETVLRKGESKSIITRRNLRKENDQNSLEKVYEP